MPLRDPSEIAEVQKRVANAAHGALYHGPDGRSLATGCAPLAESEIHTALAHLELAEQALRRARWWQAQYLTDNRNLIP